MVSRNADVPEGKRIIFRAGINLGDVIAEKGDLFGDGVNVAARLETLCEPGGIAISRAVREQIRDRLPIAFVDAGEHEVKNIARPVRVYALSAEAVGRLDPEIPSEATERGPGRLYIAAAVITAAVAGLALFAYTHLTAPLSVRAATVQGPTVAVLPFDNLTGDPTQASFADGLTEELISDLAGFKELRVIARNTTFTYKGKAVDVVEVGRKLDANYVIEGSLRHAGDQIGITASSSKAAAETISGRRTTNASKRDQSSFDPGRTRRKDQRFPCQLVGRDRLRRVAEVPLERCNGVECIRMHCPGLRSQRSTGIKRSLTTCTRLSGKLGQREPNNAEVWAMLSRVLSSQRWCGDGPRSARVGGAHKRAYLADRIMTAASRAAELAPADPLARFALANAFYVTCQRDQHRVETERAIALNSNDANVFGTLGNQLGFLGLWEIGVPPAKKGIDMSAPNTPRWWWWVVFSDQWFHGRYEQALDSLQKSYVEQNWVSHLQMAYMMPSLARVEEAKAHVATLLKMKPGFTHIGRPTPIRRCGVTSPPIRRK